MLVASLPVTRFEWNVENGKLHEKVENPLVTMVAQQI
jgi:hypothetical protein